MKKLRIALVEASAYATHVYSRKYFPRVGIPTLGTLVKALGHDCDLWFQAVGPLDEAQLREYDLVGIGSLTNTVVEAYRLADRCRRPGNTVVMGGPHVTFQADEALKHCDYVVLGEGEVSFPALVTALANGGSPQSVPGLAFRLPSGEVGTSGAAEKADFVHLPSPDFSLAPQLKRPPPIVITSRGCPHNCTFCTVKAMFGGAYQFKSNEQVIAELHPILDQSVCFGDDNFCAKVPRTKQLLRDMIKQKAVPLRWAAQMCVSIGTDDELLDLMHRTRCRTAYVGIESIDPETLRKFRKAHKTDAVALCARRLHAHGIGMHGMFIASPEDDEGSVRRIVDFALKTGMDSIQICALTPFPGTGSFEEWQDRLLHRDWQNFDGMHVVVRPTRCSPHAMQMAICGQLARFYSLPRAAVAWRPGRAWRVKYRLAGWYLVRRWLRENREYVEALPRT